MARLPEVTNSGLLARAPYREAPAAYSAATSATTRQAEPTPLTSRAAVLRLGELGRALGDERVPLGHEGPVPELALDDHLAPLPEGIRHHARVGDRDGPRP